MTNQDIGNRIKKIRQDKGLNQAEFGKLALNAHKSLVSKWEKGQNLPNNERLKAIAKIGNITVDELLHGSLDDYIIRRVNNYFKNNDSISLEEESKKKVLDDTLNQSLTNPIIVAEYEDSQLNDLNNSIDIEIKRAVERVLNKTDFTNTGFIKFVTLEIDSLNQRSFKYLNNGINKNLYSEVTTILDNCKNNINDLKDKYDNN